MKSFLEIFSISIPIIIIQNIGLIRKIERKKSVVPTKLTINIRIILALTFPRAKASHIKNIAIASKSKAAIVLRIDRSNRSFLFIFTPPIYWDTTHINIIIKHFAIFFKFILQY